MHPRLKQNQRRNFFLLSVFLVYLIHGSLLGLSDDEAYYWKLASEWRWGFAYHPPGVVWLLWLARKLLEPFGLEATSLAMRLPSAALSAAVLGLGWNWIERVSRTGTEYKSAFLLLSFAGLFGASWMMVPDLPLFLGWLLLWTGSWSYFYESENKGSALLQVGVGFSIAVISKYSAALFGVSALWMAIEMRKSRPAWPYLRALALGTLVGAIPLLLWSKANGWGSLLFQVENRHGELHLSLIRYLRFWASQLLLVGPGIIAASLALVKAKKPYERFALIWMLPQGLVFLVQPLFSDFKLHWAFPFWYMGAMILAVKVLGGEYLRMVKAQMGFGLLVYFIFMLSCHFPIQSIFAPKPVYDVTNDLYGWKDFGEWLRRTDSIDPNIPILGSRYQTAAQASFAAFGTSHPVERVPVPLLEARDWGELKGYVRTNGEDWPELLKPVLFVSDNRYSEGPHFAHSRCRTIQTIQAKRWSYLAKQIQVWKCEPKVTL